MSVLVNTFSKHSKDVTSCSFSPNSKVLASSSGDKSVRLWNVENGTELSISPLLGHSYGVNSCRFSPFGTLLATASTDGNVHLWDVNTGSVVAVLQGHKSGVRVCRFSPNSRFLVTGSADESFCIWDVSSKTLVRCVEKLESSVMTCCFTPDSLYIITGTSMGDLSIWEAQTGKMTKFYAEGHDLGVADCCFSSTYGSATTGEKEKEQTAGSLDVHCRVAIIGGGLGAWRVDGNAVNMMNLIRRLNISTVSWDYHKQSTLESRGVFALNNFAKIKQEAFPTLNRGRFKNMTSNDMMSYVFSDDRVSTAPLFTLVDSYMSYYLSPEAAEFLSELYGYKGDYKESINPAAYIEYQKMLFGPDGLSFENFRPLKGMSAVVNSLVASVRKNGGKLYSENAVLSVDTVETSFVLKTASLTILADKLVIATHPVAYLKVKGAVSEEIHREPVFQSIKIMPAFKGAAVYREAWWQNTTGNLTRLNTRQRFVSNSDCLGTSMPYGGTGPNGEAVLHTMYMDGPCSRRWGDILRTSKSHVDRELKRALEYKFGRQVPDPLDTVYQYWDEGAWHFQKPGFNYTLTEVSDWAKRPFPGQEIFIVGDAYNPYRGWTEGAILSADNALLEGWNITKKSISRRKRTKSVPLSELVLDPSTEFQIH